ncbi:MAG: RNA polymerase sporulation sigma factor SigK [Oscillospiraceae bacterium]|nr:RNA polymerase sporulation sigma factor SigK [Oscillospiraceae bacterium]MDY6209043.1 RNA polymerase sporulation sigma factor SigK [Oscillospiraceae bacterium]
MFGGLISWLLEHMLYFALHMDSSTVFPKPLSAEKEAEAFKRMAEGDDSARGELIEHNLRLVAHVVKKYYSPNVDSEELISIGTIGLIKAVSSFNNSKSTRFATYAAKCIDNEVLMYFRSAKKSARDVYLDEPVDTDKDGNSMSLMDIIAEDDNLVDRIDVMIKSRQLYGFIDKCLDEREKEVIRHRYGLYGLKPLTQREVADKLNISRSYVSRIEKKALEKLRDMYE